MNTIKSNCIIGCIGLMFIFTFCSCNRKIEKQDNVLTSFKSMMDTCFKRPFATNNRPLKAYILIPSTGCSGCISEAENLLLTLSSKKYPIRVVLSNILSYKVLRLKLGDSIVLNKNVYVDLTNEVYNKIGGLTPVYPAIFYLNLSGEPIKYEYVEPHNPNAMKRLYDYLEEGI